MLMFKYLRIFFATEELKLRKLVLLYSLEIDKKSKKLKPVFLDTRNFLCNFFMSFKSRLDGLKYDISLNTVDEFLWYLILRGKQKI